MNSTRACVAEQQKHLLRNQADLIVLRGCESYHMHQEFLGRRLTGKPSDSKPEILGSNPGVPDNFLGRPDSRVSQTVLKTAAVNNRVRFDSVAFRHFGDVA